MADRLNRMGLTPYFKNNRDLKLVDAEMKKLKQLTNINRLSFLCVASKCGENNFALFT
nr:hypothetical protein [uncultured Undibacterium sp.]